MDKLWAAAEALKLPLRCDDLPAFQRYFEELVTWNRRLNLTAITEYEQVQVRHFADSLTCLLASPGLLEAARQGLECAAIDVGAGAGFPGIPLKIVWPRLRLVLLESVGKKCAFLEHIVGELGLRQVTVINARAEQLGQDPQHRERYQVVLARAVADLPVLAEYCLPLAHRSGLMVAQKGDEVEEEIVRAERAISILGGKVERIRRVEVPGTALPRSLVVIRKVALTPAEYPRRPGVPRRRPLLGR